MKNKENTEVVQFSNWQKLDLRIGKILKAENMEGADKLYRLLIDLGKEFGKRTLVAGLKPYYKKEELEGKQCVVFINLESKKIRNIESKGMILAAVVKTNQKSFFFSPTKKSKKEVESVNLNLNFSK